MAATRAGAALWRDHEASFRSGVAIYDLIDSENARARAIAKAVDNGDLNLATMHSKKDVPIKIINELLRLSNLPIEISVMAVSRLWPVNQEVSHTV